MGRILKRLPQVPWGRLTDAQGPARDLPPLLSTVAWGDEVSASAALDELSDRVCALGFVVSEATPHVVPFLLELAGEPAVRVRADLVGLLARIHAARQWESTASAASGTDARRYREKVAWETESRHHVESGRGTLQRLVDDPDPEVAEAAGELLSALG
ncbi:hypothetical protein ACIQNG_28485 [Streptomyces sp. NPDC091377]|uniref:hypothetical protein n=1 Tax=unclassified Streptomyces TaxID=2593676 RepID=UPI00380479E3